MNERFKQLANEAQIGIFEDKSFGWSVIAGTDQHLSKFAELIVGECGIVADHWVNDEDNGTNLVSERLKQHFGVEE